jgi:hypothetical protein
MYLPAVSREKKLSYADFSVHFPLNLSQPFILCQIQFLFHLHVHPELRRGFKIARKA